MKVSWVLPIITFLLVSLVSPPEAQARKSRVERLYKGKVVILKKRPPMRFKSQGSWLHFLRVNKIQYVWPNKKAPKKWRFEFMAFFQRALKDVEVKIKFYDITDIKKFIAADSFYLNRDQTIFASDMEVESPPFSVNRKYKMFVLSARTNRVLAATSFWLRGKGEVYSGKVTFTDEETKKKD